MDRLRQYETKRGVYLSSLIAAGSFLTGGPSDRNFVRLHGDRFEAWRERAYLGSFWVFVLHGTIRKDDEGGTVVQGDFRLWGPGKAFPLVWFGFLAIGVVAGLLRGEARGAVVLVGAVLMVFGLGFFRGLRRLGEQDRHDLVDELRQDLNSQA